MSHFRHLCTAHLGNNYHPELLKGKRTLFYSLFFLTLKAIVVVAVLFVPKEAYLMPDVLAEQAQQVYDRTNEFRAEQGLAHLAQSPALNASADARAFDMVRNNYFSHTGPDNHTLAYFLQSAHYPYTVAGENLAMGFTDAPSVLTAWEESPTHRANLLDGDFRDSGVAVELGTYRGEQTVFIVQHFGTPTGVATAGVDSGQAVAAGQEVAINAVTAVVRPHSLVDYGTPNTPNTMFDRTASNIFWQQNSDGTTSLIVKARIYGSVSDAHITFQGYVIPLFRDERDKTFYTGGMTSPLSPAELFKPVVLPSITITSPGGKAVRDTIDWYNVYVPPETLVQSYFGARDFLAPFAGVFGAARVIFFSFLLVFSAVLGAALTTRHQKMTLEPLLHGLFSIGLLVVLWWV